MVTRDKGDTMFTQVCALLMEVKPYVLLDCMMSIRVTRVDLPRDRNG